MYLWFEKLYTKFERMTDSNIVYRILDVLTVLHIILIFWMAFNPSITLDEVFTLNLIKLPYGELIELATKDVHPPLYYLYAKFVVDILLRITPLTLVTAAKIASVLPIIGLVIVAKIKVSKLFKEFSANTVDITKKRGGELHGSLFAFSITAMPWILFYATEIRMYSLGLLFVTMSFIYAYEIARKPTIIKFVLLTFFSALSAYTHYFAGISAVFIYLALAGWLFKNNKKCLLKWFLSGIGVIILYLPWLIYAISMFKNVGSGYWIAEINLQTILLYAMYPFNIHYEEISSIIFCLIYAIACLWFFVRSYDNSNMEAKQRRYFTVAGVCILVATVVTGIIISLLYVPIFVERYMFFALGSFWFIFALSMSYQPENLDAIRTKNLHKSVNIFVLFTVFIVVLNSLTIVRTEVIRGQGSQKTMVEIFNKIDKDDIIVTDYSHIAAISTYLTAAETILLDDEAFEAEADFYKTVFANVSTIGEDNKYNEISASDSKVWILLNAADLSSMGISNTDAIESMGTYGYDSYLFSVYCNHITG